MSDTENRSLLEALGGEAGCRRLAQDFYRRVATSDELKPLFPGKSLRCATEEFAAFLVQFLDGEESATQYRWWLSLRESHSRFEISAQQHSAWLSLMHAAISSSIEDASTRQKLQQFFGVTSAYIVGKDRGEPEDDELKGRWHRQRLLDRLIDDIAGGRDADAIVLSRQLAPPPTVFVGILARMMEAGRKPLIDFVLECVRGDRRLMESRFNGRTLLHLAAGHSCLPIVRQLLALGVDPNVLDNGGHTALYRVASTRRDVEGASVVDELVRAGATVDHCGGANRSSPLHEAARHGNVEVAKALLRCGACVELRDKKGLTPLDRAINCRKHEVAAVLASYPERGARGSHNFAGSLSD